MTRRVLYTLSSILFATLLLWVYFDWNTHVVEIGWDYPVTVPRCGGVVQTSCVTNLTLLVFHNDNTEIVKHLNPYDRVYHIRLKPDSYVVWLVVTGRDDKGKLTISDPAETEITVPAGITPHFTTTDDTTTEQQQ